MPQGSGGSGRGDLARASVLAVLGTRGPTSRVEITRLLDVSPATITQTTKELLSRRLIVELELVPSPFGRPARLLGLARPAGVAIGAKVMADRITAVVVEMNGEVRSSQALPLDTSAEDATDRLGDLLAGVVATEGDVLGVGVGVPGTVDSQASGVVSAPTLGWEPRPLGRQLRDRLGVPVLVDNDVNTLAAAERLYGAGRQHTNYLVVTIGRGVGCAVVHEGVVARGAHGGAGEIGHIPVADDGALCGCGNHGCLEAYVGEAGLLRSAVAASAAGPDSNMADLLRAARSGNQPALGVFASAGALLGRTLAGVVHTFDPEVLVLLGEGVAGWPLWRDGFEASFRRHLMPARRDVPVLIEPWTDDQWARGAACLVLSSPFDTAGAAGDQGELVRARLQAAEPIGVTTSVGAMPALTS